MKVEWFQAYVITIIKKNFLIICLLYTQLLIPYPTSNFQKFLNFYNNKN